MLIPLVACILGIALALIVPLVIPVYLMRYVGIFILVVLMLLIMSIEAKLKGNFKLKIFISGLLVVSVVSEALVYISDKLDLDIYPVCILLLLIGSIKGGYDIFKHFTGRKNNG